MIQEVDFAERTAIYGFMSALLCRRTFFTQAYSDVDLDGDSFKSFVEATLAMQESLVVDLNRFSTATRNMLVRDIKMTFRMRAMIRRLAVRYPSSVESVIDTVWLNSHMVAMLQTIANLTPRRHYYPKNMKRQQNVSWDPELTTTIQHDAYKLVVDSIVEKSQRLWLFQANAPEPPKNEEIWTIPHLRERAHWRGLCTNAQRCCLQSSSRPLTERTHFEGNGHGHYELPTLAKF